MAGSPLNSVRSWGVSQWGAATGIVASVATVVALVNPFGGSDQKQQTPAQGAKEGALALFTNQYGAAWDHLHPVDQKLVSRSRYVACERRKGGSVALLSMVTNGVAPAETNRPGLAKDAAKVVSFAVKVQGASGPEFHEIVFDVAKAGDRWRMLIPEQDYPAYKAGRCPAVQSPKAPPPSGGDKVIP